MRTRSSQLSEEMQGGNNMSHLENVLANLTTLVAQQAANTAAREEAEAQRAAADAALAAQNQAEEDARRAQREERELIAAHTRGLNLKVSKLPFDLIVSIPASESLTTNTACLECPWTYRGKKLVV